MQLTVTPKIEGVLQVVGIRWKLSDSVMGFHNFIDNLGQKNIAKGRQKAKHSLADNLKFIVIKVRIFFLASQIIFWLFAFKILELQIKL